VLSLIGDRQKKNKKKQGIRQTMNEKDFDSSLAETSVSLKLELIQRRCTELLDDPDSMLELALEEPTADAGNSGDPYNHLS
jgi:hypothetical protein